MLKSVEEIEELKRDILNMALAVQNAIDKSLKALMDHNVELAHEIIKGDDDIDLMEVQIEQACIRIIALYQPEASDLRLVMGVYKIVSDLERMADEAENIAERVIALSKEPPLKPYINLTLMANNAKEMVSDSVVSFLQKDKELAEKVIEKDSIVDELYHQLERELITYVMEDPRNITKVISLQFIARHFERIADHAENIAEMAIYLKQGEMVKHKHN